jgi:hypothetical protein
MAPFPEFLRKSMPLLALMMFIIVGSVGALAGSLWGAVGIVGALFLFLATWRIDGDLPQPSKQLLILALLTLLIFAAELPLSSQPPVSLRTWGQLASIFLSLSLLTAPELQARAFSAWLPPVAAVATSFGALVLGGELLSGGFLLHSLKGANAPLTEYNRGIAHLVILAFPLLAGLWITGRKRAAIALAVILLFPAGLTESRTAKLALIVGLAVTLGAHRFPIWTPRLLAGFPFTLFGWPFAASWLFQNHADTLAHMPPSWRHRIEIWDYLSYRIAERPWFGWGLGATHTLDFHQPHGELYLYATQAASHAHNFITELWVETGVPGLALGTMFLLFTLHKSASLPAQLRPFALGGWMAAIIVSLVGFNWWTDALWAAFALSAFLFGGLAQQQKTHAKP